MSKTSSEEKVTYVNQDSVKCEGEAEKIGHPLIYLNFGKSDSLTCPYCSHLFKLNRN